MRLADSKKVEIGPVEDHQPRSHPPLLVSGRSSCGAFRTQRTPSKSYDFRATPSSLRGARRATKQSRSRSALAPGLLPPAFAGANGFARNDERVNSASHKPIELPVIRQGRVDLPA